MTRPLVAGTVYFLLLFALGFVLGTLRVLVVAPRLGEVWATLMEVPVMLLAAYAICGWAMRYWQVPPAIPVRLGIALWFMMLLLVFETILGVTLFERSLAELAATLTSPAGLLGLAAQGVAALFPLILERGENQR
jgi:hypothetical protein